MAEKVQEHRTVLEAIERAVPEVVTKAQEHGIILKTIEGAIPEVVRRAQEHEIILKAIQRAIPATIRYTWDPDHKPVYFITALDRRLELPYELCYQLKVWRQYPNQDQVCIRRVTLKHALTALDVSRYSEGDFRGVPGERVGE